MSRDYYQFAYVTRDIRHAMEEIGRQHQIGGYMEMPDTVFPTGPDSEAVAHFALAYKGAVQFEIIQPLDKDVDTYRQLLPTEGNAPRFHHVGRHFDRLEDCQAELAKARARWHVPMESATDGGFYAYADARADFGHFLEFFWFPVGSHLDAVPRY